MGDMAIVIPGWMYPVIAWMLVWKALAMWRAARNNQVIWFVVTLVINTVGILPILYILFFQRDRNVVVRRVVKKRSRKK